MISNVKCQMSNVKCKSFVFLFAILMFTIGILNFQPALAKDITIIYSGETHAMIYTCSCPKEQDGGVARRATLIKELRKKYPNSLVLDSGSFFAGGLMDEYTQNTEMDKRRTEINLKSMELMNYDAVALGDDEFNFGKEFLSGSIEKTNLTFLSANVKISKSLPYIIKVVDGLKVAVIGVSSLSAKEKSEGIAVLDLKKAVGEAILEVRQKGASIVVLMGHLSEGEGQDLVSGVAGIDIFIQGHAQSNPDQPSKIGNTIVLRPSWQGRRLGRATFAIKDNRITDHKSEDMRLSDKVVSDKDILKILPACFSDFNCKKDGVVGTCSNPGTQEASCSFKEPGKVSLTIVTSKSCVTCNTEQTVNNLKRLFPKLSVSNINYSDKKAKDLIDSFKIKTLPAYFLSKEAEKESSFSGLKPNLQLKGEYYYLKPQLGGLTYFIDRKNNKGSLDLFISLFDKNATSVLQTIKEFNPEVHFLTVQQGNSFDAAKGSPEVEEYLRATCVRKYYPEAFWGYITCRAKNINSSWWEDCLDRYNTGVIRSCAKSDEGKQLLKENIKLNKEIEVMYGPTYLVDNQEIFSSNGAPSSEELKKIIKK